jgi:hypothetical protein
MSPLCDVSLSANGRVESNVETTSANVQNKLGGEMHVHFRNKCVRV